MRIIQKLRKKKNTLKESLLKSIIYRIITITLGMLVGLILTRNIIDALYITLITESVQFGNYFIYESVWTNYHDKKLRREIEKTKEVDVKLDFDLLKEISFEFSQTSVYVREAYDSIMTYFEKLLQNENLTEIHHDIQRDKNYFELKHKDMSFIR